MSKKLVSLVLALALLLSCMSAVAEEAIVSALPLVEEPATLWFAGIRSPGIKEDLSNVPSFKRWQEETGITIKWDLYSSEAWAQQKQLILLGGGEMPDAICGGNPLSDSDITAWTDAGVLMPLKSLSEEYMPRFQQIMRQYPAYYKSMTDNAGEFYAFPTHFDIDFGNRGSLLYMSRSILDQVGEFNYVDKEFFTMIDRSFTTDEFYKLLKDIKEKTGAIPLSAGDIGELSQLFWPFGCNESTRLIYVKDGKVKTFLEDESFVEACEYIHKLYAEGLIDAEIATHSNDGYRAKLMEKDAVGTTFMWSGLIAVDDYANMEDPRYSDWVGCVPLIGPRGDQVYCMGTTGVAIKGSCAILATSKKADLVCKFMDYLYNEDNSYQLSYGDFGYGLKKEKDGRLTQFFSDNSSSAVDVAMLNTMFITTAEMNSRINYAPATAMAIECGAELAKPFHLNCFFPQMNVPEEYVSDLAELSTDLKTYYTRVRAELIMEGKAAERIQEIKQEMYDIGLQKYIDIYQAMLNLYNK